jgi:hypothetical protein
VRGVVRFASFSRRSCQLGKQSNPITSSPRFRRASQTCDPRNPAAPVTTQRVVVGRCFLGIRVAGAQADSGSGGEGGEGRLIGKSFVERTDFSRKNSRRGTRHIEIASARAARSMDKFGHQSPY